MPLLLRVRGQRAGGSACRRRPAGSRRRWPRRPGLRYERADGTDPVGVFDVAEDLAEWVREHAPAGRAPPAHRALRRPRRHRRRVGLPHARRRSAPTRRATRCWRRPGVLVACRRGDAGRDRRPLPRRPRRRARARGDRCWPSGRRLRTPRRRSMAPLSPRTPGRGRRRQRLDGRRRPSARRVLRRGCPRTEGRLTLAESINRTLGDLLAADDRVLVFGEDVGAKGGVYGVTRGPAAQGRAAAGVRHAARRAVDPRAGPRRRRVRARADPRDPVPRLPAQRRGPAARRGGQPVVLLQRPVPQPARRAHRRLRLPEGVRRPLPQRQRASPCCATSRASSSPRRRTRPTPRRCCARASAAAVDRRHGQRVPRADRPLPHRDLHDAGDDGWTAPYAAPAAWARRATCRSVRRPSPARATTCSS